MALQRARVHRTCDCFLRRDGPAVSSHAGAGHVLLPWRWPRSCFGFSNGSDGLLPTPINLKGVGLNEQTPYYLACADSTSRAVDADGHRRSGPQALVDSGSAWPGMDFPAPW